jgi:signal transduction histidine kinase
MPPAEVPQSAPILILAPTGRDAVEVTRVLTGIGVSAEAVASLTALCAELRRDGTAGVTAVILTEEALADGAEALMACLAGQPPWSDLPIVALTASGRRRGSGRRWTLFEALGNVTLLDRPLHAEELRSAARAALRVRARQHETRQHLETLRLAAETLEVRVEERTRELMAVEATLRQAQKMEAVGQLTGGIAHDFNNMLTAITGSLELMQSRVAQGRLTGLDRYINMAQGGAQRAAALTHRLLAFSRRQTLDPRPTAVNRLVTGLEELLQRTVGPEITITTRLAPDVHAALCDRHQLENALLNLCINARDAMPDGGSLVIRTEDVSMDEQAARERDIAPGHYVAISVADSGVGMAPEIAARAFDPFFTTKPAGQGTGLGLSMIYGFARQSGGEVRIRSQPGQGTTVRILLPRQAGTSDDDVVQLGSVSALRAEGDGTVLVVDDEASVRALVAEVLEGLGYKVIEAADGPSGLTVLRSDVRIDLLVSDVGMPGGMNGRQMVDAARQQRPALRVLFITGYAERAVFGDGEMPADMHLMVKPFTMQALANRIKELIG